MAQRTFTILSFIFFTALSLSAQKVMPEAIKVENKDNTTELVLFSGKYFSWTTFSTDKNEFIATKGGQWSRERGNLILNYEFHTQDPTQVNKTVSYKRSSIRKQLFSESKESIITIENKLPSASLANPYLISGRKQNGEIQRMDITRPRKTMKLLTGRYFQWIAFNTETGEFFGTGGGTYTAQEGKYTEYILFFSRDNSRVGATLSFDFELKGEDWHHSGLSSKGDPIYEIWTVRK